MRTAVSHLNLRILALVALLATFTVAIGYTLPELRGSIRDLRRAETRNLTALNIASELKADIEVYVRLGDNQHRKQIESLAEVLAASDVSGPSAREFQQQWRRAVKLSRVEGPRSFETVPQAAAAIQQAIEQSSSRSLQHASSSILTAVVQLIVLLAVIFLCSALFVWVECRHRKIIRQLAEAHREVRESEDRFRNAYEEASVGMAMLDLKGRVLAVNRAMTEITGFNRQELIGMASSDCLFPEERLEAASMLQRLVSGALGPYRVERRGLRKDGRMIWMRNSVSLLRSQNRPASIFIIAEDVTDRRAAFEAIEYQATHDRVTSLVNRFGFEKFLRKRMEIHAGTGASTGLLYLDLDAFKQINDTLGHTSGDLVLSEVARRMSRCLASPGDLLARLGGDEFALVVNDSHGREHLAELAREILRVLDEPFAIAGKEVHVGVTIGIASCPEDGSDPSILLQSADSAMYEAKRAGKHRYSFFTESMREQARDRRRIESCLRAALARGEFSVSYQPLYELGRGNLVRFEALCRWYSPELGEVSPTRFIPVAEECGLIGELGEFVLRQASKDARRWMDAGSYAGVAVNVSAIQFGNPSFVETVKETLAAAGLPSDRLELELTESVILRNIEQGISKIDELRDMGIRVAVDDFGTGYSSLSYLQKMPVYSVKIDRSFVTDIDSNERSVSMIRSVIAMAHAVGLVVVTEGVETASQLGLLRDLGCDEVQGFLFGEPMPAASALHGIIGDNRCQDDIARLLAQTAVN